MSIVQTIALASDRVMATLVAGLEREFGCGAGAALAARFLDAEEIDIHWDARGRERWIGAYEAGEENIELDRVAAMGFLDGCWFVAIFIVDGDGNAHGMQSCRTCPSADRAVLALAQAR